MRGVKTPFLTVAFALLLMCGCGHRYHLSDERLSQARASQLEKAVFDGTLDVIWESSFNSKPSGPLSIHGGALAVSSAKRRVEFFDAESGDHLGRIKTNGVVHTRLFYMDSLVVFGVESPRGRVVCWDLARHEEVWRYPVADVAGIAPMAGDRLLAADRSGRLSLLQLDSGDTLWTSHAASRLSAAPFPDGGGAYVAREDGCVFRYHCDTGEESEMVCDLEAAVVQVMASSELLWVVYNDGVIRSVHLADGSLLYTRSLSSDRWSEPALSGDTIFLTSSRGEVVALGSYDLAEVWRIDVEEAVRAKPVVVDGIVLVATMRGKLISLDSRSGEIIDQRDLGSAIDQSPVADGGRVFVATRGGDVVCLGNQLVP